VDQIDANGWKSVANIGSGAAMALAIKMPLE